MTYNFSQARSNRGKSSGGLTRRGVDGGKQGRKEENGRKTLGEKGHRRVRRVESIPRASNSAGSGGGAVKSRGTPFRSVAEWSSKGSVESERVLMAFFIVFPGSFFLQKTTSRKRR